MNTIKSCIAAVCAGFIGTAKAEVYISTHVGYGAETGKVSLYNASTSTTDTENLYSVHGIPVGLSLGWQFRSGRLFSAFDTTIQYTKLDEKIAFHGTESGSSRATDTLTFKKTDPSYGVSLKFGWNATPHTAIYGIGRVMYDAWKIEYDAYDHPTAFNEKFSKKAFTFEPGIGIQTQINRKFSMNLEALYSFGSESKFKIQDHAGTNHFDDKDATITNRKLSFRISMIYHFGKSLRHKPQHPVAVRPAPIMIKGPSKTRHKPKHHKKGKKAAAKAVKGGIPDQKTPMEKLAELKAQNPQTPIVAPTPQAMYPNAVYPTA